MILSLIRGMLALDVIDIGSVLSIFVRFGSGRRKYYKIFGAHLTSNRLCEV